MTITLNGDPADLPGGSTVTALAASLALPERGVAIAIDGEVVPRSAWAETVVPEQARVEVVTPMQGG